MVTLPLTNDPIQRFQIQLENAIYGFRVIYNSRGDYWSFDIYNADNVLLAASIKIVVGADLIRAYRLNMGKFIAVNVSDNQNDPGEESILGTDVLLYYISKDELDVLRGVDA